MEYVEFGDLQHYINDQLIPETEARDIAFQLIPETEARDIAFQLMKGLQFMHENGFYHGDLKPGVRIFHS